MTVLLALLLLSSTPSPPDTPERATTVTRCRESCERHLAASGKGSVCTRCLTAGDRAAWVWEMAKLKPFPRDAYKAVLNDGDWVEQWAALRVLARRELKAEKSYLATWVMRASGPAVAPACITAARVAASQGLSTAELLAGAGHDGPSAAARVWERREDVRRALEVELYDFNPEIRREALAHLARFLGRSPGRVVLDAMATRPPSSDQVAASALEEICARTGATLEQALLHNARPEDKPLVDRLLRVYAGEIDHMKGKLRSNNTAERKEAVATLRRLSPLSAPELEAALLDPDASVRLLAAKTLAATANQGLAEHVRSLAGTWDMPGSASPEVQARWVEVLGHSGDKGCAPVLKELSHSARLAGVVRAAAVEGMAACSPRDALKLVGPGLADPSPEVRAAAVRGLSALPRQRAAEDAAARALEDSDPEVVASAVSLVAAQGQGRQGARIARLLSHPSAHVREAAAQALARMPGNDAYVRDLAKSAREDDSAGVRAAAVLTLGSIGGPVALNVLTSATQDPDGRVQYLAKETLRKLGFQR